jgi:hydrophobic/amphiphilic exporter-1 (mainly G- bacteria), HAE1 family
MRRFIETAVRRRVTVIMLTLAVIAFGLVGYRRLPLELFPDITYPSLTVQTEFPDTAPPEVENLVTKPIEEAVGVLRGLQSVHSVSRPGVSEVTLEFDWGTDMDQMSMEVREKLDRRLLPEEARDPVVLRFDPALDPIVRLSLSGPGELTELRRFAERQIKQDLETVKGVASAQIKGGLESEVQVAVDQERLAALGIPLDRLRAVLGVSNVNLPGGALRGQESQYLIRTVNEFDTVEEIGDLVVAQQDGAPVRLHDVAKVWMGAKEREEITRVGGKEAVEIAIYKEGDANAVSVSRLLKQRLDQWRAKLPAGQSIEVLFDQSEFIKQSLDEVRDSALIGGLLAIAVLFLFLRDVRSTLIIAVSIPISIIATFVVMYRMGISLNVMSLGGLTLGIGMLVDNSIVVLESIFRKRQEGLPLFRAAVEGTDEVGAAVIASTLTTVVVFVPLIFVEGVAGQLFKDQALTVTISLLASLVVALTVAPMFASLGGRSVAVGPDDDQLAAGSKLSLGRVSQRYDNVVRAAVRRAPLTIALALGAFALALLGASRLDTELIPQLTEGEFFLEMNLPEGTALPATDRVVAAVEKEAAGEPAIERYYSTIGSRLVSGGMSLNTKGENLAQINVAMKDRSDDVTEAAVIDRLRQGYANQPDLQVKVGRPSYFTLKTPIEVAVYGEDLEALRDYSLELVGDLEAVPGLVDVRSSLEAGNPELQVVFDRERLAALGLDMGTMSQTLKQRVQGVVPTRFKEADRQIDIRLRNDEDTRRSLDDVRNLVLPGPDGQPLRLLSVADVRLERGPAEIHRLQQQRAAMITANLDGRGLGAAVADVEAKLAADPPPAGLSTEIGGQNREMQVSYRSLRFALILAVFLVYLVMASTFESFLHPLIVLATIPLSIVGVVLGLLLLGIPINVMVLIGVILLAGVVVNNAIVLIDCVNRLRRRGVDKVEAVVMAGHIRLRPILMTTLTSVLGLLPMALAWGEGSELRQPLAITVLFGLSVATLLTLVVIPAVYVLVPSHVRTDAELAALAGPAAGSPGAAAAPATTPAEGLS